MNILITSIGTRGYLVDHFKDSLGSSVGVFVADATKYAPAFKNADRAFVVPMANDKKYFRTLLNICLENEIKIVLSINDLELPIISKYKNEFGKHGIEVIISDQETINICFDKYKTYKFCLENNISVPRTYLYTEKSNIIKDIKNNLIKLPIIAKPRKGSRSVGIHLVHTIEELEQEVSNLYTSTIAEDEKIMFQEYVDSEQYSIHVFNNKEFKPISVITMVNLFKHMGETFHIKTFRDTKLIELGFDIGNKLKHLGPLSADVHKNKDGDYVVLEFNPRISGCYSLSHFAGANYPEKIYNIYKGDLTIPKKIDDFEDDVIMLKQFTTYKTSLSKINNF